MNRTERKAPSAQDAEHKALIGSVFNELREQAPFGIISSGQFFPGEPSQPTYRFDFDVVTQQAVFEIETREHYGEEVRRYIFTHDSVKKGGYVDGPDGVTHYTDEKEEYLKRGLEDGEYLADTLDVPFHELDTLSKLVFAPEDNAHLLESLPRLPF